MTESVRGATLRALLADLPDAIKDVIGDLVYIIIITEAGHKPSGALQEWWNESKEDLLDLVRTKPEWF